MTIHFHEKSSSSLISPLQMSPQPSRNDWTCIVPQQHASYGNIEQQSYGNKMLQAVNEILEDMLRGKISSFRELLSSAAKHRKEIAIDATKGLPKSKDLNPKDFGELRSHLSTNNTITPLYGIYNPLFEEVKLLRGPNDKKREGVQGNIYWSLFTSKEERGFCFGYVIGTLSQTNPFLQNKTKNEHTELEAKLQANQILLSKFEFSRLDGEENHKKYHKLIHTKPFQFNAIFHECQIIYETIQQLDSRIHAEEIKQEIAKMHWWIVQATPFKRGTASCAEVIVSALVLYKDLSLTPWKKGINSDFFAFVLSLEDFVAKYDSFRE